MKKQNASVDTMSKSKVESILISQPQPETQRSPYFTIAEKFGVKIDFNQFINVEGVNIKDFRKQRIQIDSFQAVIFTSRNAMDHYFRLCEELRVTISQETKYFCMSEAIALYLQKHIQYRKRKVFYANGTLEDFKLLLMKYKSAGRFLYPCTDVSNNPIPDFLKENDFKFKEGTLYRTVSCNLKEEGVDVQKYDMLVFFSPLGIKSLIENFPKFNQGDIKIAAFGPSTCEAVSEAGLRLDIEVPTPSTPSMSQAIEHFLDENQS